MQINSRVNIRKSKSNLFKFDGKSKPDIKSPAHHKTYNSLISSPCGPSRFIF